MTWKLISTIAVTIALSVVAFAQGATTAELQDQLPVQSEIQETLGENWLLSDISAFGTLPDGATGSAIGQYSDGNNDLTIVLLSFESGEIAGLFVDGFLETDFVVEIVDVIESNVEILPEQLVQVADRIILVRLDNELDQLLVQIGSLYYYVRVEGLDLELLVALADLQLSRTLNFCANIEGEAPQYCPPEPEERAESE